MLKAPTFIYTVNTIELSKHFKEFSEPDKNSPYYQYVSKNFYGAVIRSEISLESFDQEQVVVSVRVKGRSNSHQTVTGVKIDLIAFDDPRLEQYGINTGQLSEVSIQVQSNIPGNIVLNPDPAVASVFFYKRKDGASIINFIPH